MINLRYHIVSLTAVFLAIGIGLTLGSTFLDRATVENLNGQLVNLEERLEERNAQIGELQDEVDRASALQESLDEQGPELLADRLEPEPVLVVASEGVDEEDVEGAVRSLQIAGADVLGLWWLQERFLLASDADVADLATALEEASDDPARLRRMAVAALADALRERQLEEAAAPGTVDPEVTDPGVVGGETDGGDPTGGATPGAGEPTTGGELPAEGQGATEDPTTGAETDAEVVEDDDAGSIEDLPYVQALIDAGFVRFEGVDGGPDAAVLPPGVRVVVVGGSSAVPDDVVVTPLVARMAGDVSEPLGTVVSSALGEEAQVSEAVAAVRDDERLRAVVSTVDDLDHFQGWLATVLAIDDLAEDVVGHYGLGEGASSLLPPLRAP